MANSNLSNCLSLKNSHLHSNFLKDLWLSEHVVGVIGVRFSSVCWLLVEESYRKTSACLDPKFCNHTVIKLYTLDKP